MSNRARATALALVNWKGVFYERYLLDRHVTALEGANGAGKTTVMIGAYVVLMPDLSRLRFTNLGESGATGGDRGIWGRLGEPGRPSYAALEFDLPGGGGRVLAGIHLERKAEPVLALTPFLVTGLDLGGRLRELLLVSDGDHDQVPNLEEVRDAAGRLGAQYKAFGSSKDYFSALFELGITPLRLTGDEDRNKLNEMLRTSMTGGISRALTSELRNFLLKEESGLSDTLSRMRQNLDACHRTRLEVAEARKLEHEINGIYAAAHAMFAAAVWATRGRETEARALLEGERARLGELSGAISAMRAGVEEARARRETIEARAHDAQQARDVAVAVRDRTRRARAVGVQLERLTSELAAAHLAADSARHTAEVALERRRQQKLACDAARATELRAAHGLAHFQTGLDELHRNAHAYRHGLERLAYAREALGEPELQAEAAEERLAGVRADIENLDAERSRLDGAAERAARTTRDRELAEGALERILGEKAQEPYEEAQRMLLRLTRLEAPAARATELATEVDRLRALAAKQARVRERAEALELGAEASTAMGVERRFVELEEELRALELEARTHDTSAELAQQRGRAVEARVGALELDHARWKDLAQLISRLAPEPGRAQSRSDIVELRARWLAEREELQRQCWQLETRRTERRLQVQSLEAGGGALPAELLRLRDELDAELMASRLEDLNVEEAAAFEARLGPLAHALIVDDPESAARALVDKPRELDSVWLVAATSEPIPAEPLSGEQDLVVRDFGAVRVTRIPTRPALGRRARERRAEELRREIEESSSAHETLSARARRLDALVRDVDRALEQGALLGRGDPGPELEAQRRELGELRGADARARAAAAATRARVSSLRPRLEALRGLLSEAYLFEAPDYAAELGAAVERHAEATAAAAELRRTAEDRRVLAELADALRGEMKGPEEAARLAARRSELDSAREAAFRAAEALAEVARSRGALRFADAERALSVRQDVLPALEAQHRAAMDLVAAEEAELTRREAEWEGSVLLRQQADASVQALDAHRARLALELEAEAVGDATDQSVLDATEAASAAEAAYEAIAREQRTLAAELAVREERYAQLERAAEQVSREVAARESEARAVEERWATFARLAESSSALTPVLAQQDTEARARSSTELWSEAHAKCSLLLDRLDAARGGPELTAEIRAWLAPSERSADVYLRIWARSREWLEGRLPAQVAGGDDPLESLARLRDDLKVLEQRLTRQEADLRGASDDVARSIDVQLRRARSQVRRLNQNLEGVRFGSIAGIRVQMKRIERMDQVLSALREGSMQSLLFQPNLPIEEALDEIFRRHAGGRSGGQRLLDYREYAELGVEIQRQASTDWEVASPTRLSTGEAIGVGAALMMVILTEWERDANLLRGKRAGGSLRFLFLDEANRLSQDNLGVLFDLCQNLDLQLLIAAPEVARARGNTTYRLVRRLAEDGTEEVLVSGRRAVHDGVPSSDAAAVESDPQLRQAQAPDDTSAP